MFKQRLFLAIFLPLLLVACTAQTEPKPAQKAPTHFPTREEQPAPEQPEEPEESEQLTYPDPVPADYYGSWRITDCVYSWRGCYDDRNSAVRGEVLNISEQNITLMDYSFSVGECYRTTIEEYLATNLHAETWVHWMCGGEIMDGEVITPGTQSLSYALRCNEDETLGISLDLSVKNDFLIGFKECFGGTEYLVVHSTFRLERIN